MGKTIDEYVELLYKWNSRIRLVGEKDPEVFKKGLLQEVMKSRRLIVDIKWETAIDIGSGNGLLAVPFSVVYPDRRVVAIDSSLKKCTFLKHVGKGLKLSNLEVVHSRFEEYIYGKKESDMALWMARGLEIEPEVFCNKISQFPGSHVFLFANSGKKSWSILEVGRNIFQVVAEELLSQEPLRKVLVLKVIENVSRET